MQVKQSDFGDGLFATESTLELVENPLFWVSDFTCQNCLKKPLLNYYCVCRTMYCSKACQKTDWKTHKHECKGLSNCESIPLIVKMLVRCLIWKEMHPTKWSTFEWLHYTLRDTEWMPPAGLLASRILGLLFQKHVPDTQSLFGILARITMNQFGALANDYSTSVGLVIYSTISKTNHACSPNSFIVFDGRVGTLRNLKPLKPGQEITISYDDPRKHVWERRQNLKAAYDFECTCSKCKSDLKDCKLLPPSYTDLMMQYQAALESQDYQSLIKTYDCFLEMDSKGYLNHELDQTSGCRSALILGHLEQQEYYKAYELVLLQLKSTSAIFGKNHAMTTLELATLFKASSVLFGCTKVTLDWGVQALDALNTTHGSAHSLSIEMKQYFKEHLDEAKLLAAQAG